MTYYDVLESQLARTPNYNYFLLRDLAQELNRMKNEETFEYWLNAKVDN